MKEGTGDKFGLLVQGISNFVIGLIVAFMYSWKLTLITLAMMPLLMFFVSLLGYVC